MNSMNSLQKLLTRQNPHEIRLCEQYEQYEQFFLHVRVRTREINFFSDKTNFSRV